MTCGLNECASGKFESLEALADHWRNACQSIEVECNDCGQEFLRLFLGQHNCGAMLKSLVAQQRAEIAALKEEVAELRAENLRLRRGGDEELKQPPAPTVVN